MRFDPNAMSSSNPGVAAVALDHFNDVLSNLVAVIAAVLAAWYGLDAADPAGARIVGGQCQAPVGEFTEQI